jgi:hypothetical protein
LAYLANPGLNPDVLAFKAMQPVAQGLGMTIKSVEARSQNDFKRAFSEMKQARVDGLVVSQNVVFQNRGDRGPRCATASPRRRGRVCRCRWSCGLASDLYRRAAIYVDKS